MTGASLQRPLLAVELPYFLAPRANWEQRLVQVRQCGANAVLLRVPWAWHEPQPGHVDLLGQSEPRRNLIGLIELSGQLGLRILLDVGPWLDERIIGGGLPAWLSQQAPAAFSASGWLCELHPEYLAIARHWFATLAAALAPLQSQVALAGRYRAASPLLPANIDTYPFVGETLWSRWLSERRSSLPPADAWAPMQHAARLAAFADWYAVQRDGTIESWLRADGLVLPQLAVGTRYSASVPAAVGTHYSASVQSAVGTRYSASVPAAVGTHYSASVPAGGDQLELLANGGVQLIASADYDAWPDNPAILAQPPTQSFHGWLPPDTRHLLILLGAIEDDLAAAVRPADIALGYSRLAWRTAQGLPQADEYARHVAAVIQALDDAALTFDVIDIDAADDSALQRYALLLVPAPPFLAAAAQARLARCENLALVGAARVLHDEDFSPCSILDQAEQQFGLLRLSADLSAEHLIGLVEERGGIARYAWADGAGVVVRMFHGAEFTYLSIANHHATTYTGLLSYRDAKREILHHHTRIGGGQTGMVVLREDDVVGAVFSGDGALGSWLARGARTSIVFNGGAGVVAPCGDSILVSASQSGQFQLRRPTGWHSLAGQRMLASGTILPGVAQHDEQHLTLPYLAQDQQGRTALHALTTSGKLSPHLHALLVTFLRGRAAALRQAAAIAAALFAGDATQLALAADVQDAAAKLETLADGEVSLYGYRAIWAQAALPARRARALWTDALRHARTTYLAGGLEEPAHAQIEASLSSVLTILDGEA